MAGNNQIVVSERVFAAHEKSSVVRRKAFIHSCGCKGKSCGPGLGGGDWKNTHRRFCRWRDRGVWAGLLEAVIDDPNFEWLMIDASYIKAHPTVPVPGAETKPLPAQKGAEQQTPLGGGLPRHAGKAGGYRRYGLPDCSQVLPLIEGIEAECLLADKAYDTNKIIAGALGINPVIPPKSNRREPRDYDRALYKFEALGGERLPGLQAVARGGHPVFQKDGIILGRLPTPGSDDLEQTLLTTPPNTTAADTRC